MLLATPASTRASKPKSKAVSQPDAAIVALTERHARLRRELRQVLSRDGRRRELPQVLDALHEARQALERRLCASSAD